MDSSNVSYGRIGTIRIKTFRVKGSYGVITVRIAANYCRHRKALHDIVVKAADRFIDTVIDEVDAFPETDRDDIVVIKLDLGYVPAGARKDCLVPFVEDLQEVLVNMQKELILAHSRDNEMTPAQV